VILRALTAVTPNSISPGHNALAPSHTRSYLLTAQSIMTVKAALLFAFLSPLTQKGNVVEAAHCICKARTCSSKAGMSVLWLVVHRCGGQLESTATSSSDRRQPTQTCGALICPDFDELHVRDDRTGCIERPTSVRSGGGSASQVKPTLHITHISNMGVWQRFRWVICGGVIVELFEKGALHADPPNSPPFHAIVSEKALPRSTIQNRSSGLFFDRSRKFNNAYRTLQPNIVPCHVGHYSSS
jgi:hypothetical protein